MGRVLFPDMKVFPVIVLAATLAMAFPAWAGHPIPEDSKERWDFRGPPRTITLDSFARLFACKTYEELRDALILAIEDLEHEPDDPTPLYVASDCRLALIRTYYILGDLANADRLLSQYSLVHLDAEGRPDLSREPLRAPPQQGKPAQPGHGASPQAQEPDGGGGP